MSIKYVSIPEKYLKTDILSTDSSFKLRDITWYTGSDGTAVSIASSDFGTTGYGVFEPRTSRQEFFTFDPSTIASATSTGVTINSRGLPWGSDYSTSSSTRKFAHPSGSKVLIFTDAPAMWNEMAAKANTETISAVWTFSATPIISNAPSGSTDAANKAYVDGVAVAGAPNASTTVKGIVEIATGAELAAGTGTGGTGAAIVPAGSSFTNTSAGAGDANKVPVLDSGGQLAVGFIPSITGLTGSSYLVPTGAIIPYGANTAPTGWLKCDGSAVSRSTYATLFALLYPTVGTFTITLASPGVVTLTAHGLATGDGVYLTTTGALPTGLSANTRYWVIKVNADTFQLATSLANALAGTGINTSGSQSGTHTAKLAPFGVGDGSTTFNVPDLQQRLPIGKDQTDTDFAGLGQTGGAQSVTLTTTELPAHTHTFTTRNGLGTSASPLQATDGGAAGNTATSSSTGTGSAFSILNPYLALTFIIKT